MRRFPKKTKKAPQTALIKLWNRYVRGAKERQIPFLLWRKEFEELVKSPCHYCGVEPKQKIKSTVDILYYNGIDRKDSNSPYVIYNCVPSCFVCNKLKNTMLYDDFLEHVNKIKEKNNG